MLFPVLAIKSTRKCCPRPSNRRYTSASCQLGATRLHGPNGTQFSNWAQQYQRQRPFSGYSSMRPSANLLTDKNSSWHICVWVHTAFGFPLSFGWLFGFSFVFCRTQTRPTKISFRPTLPAICSLFQPLPIFSLSRDYDICYAGWLSPWRGAVLRRSGSFSRYDLAGAAGGAKPCLQYTT